MPLESVRSGAGILRIVNWIGELVGSVIPVMLLALVIISVGADVLGRNVFSAPIFGASEVSVLAFVWLVWLGVIGAAKRDDLMGVRYFVDLLPHRSKHLVHATVNITVALIAAGVIYAAIMQIRTARFTTFMSINVPKWVLSVGLLISMAAILAMFLGKAWNELKRARGAGR
jgi:TRAP-type transport system small permease protein